MTNLIEELGTDAEPHWMDIPTEPGELQETKHEVSSMGMLLVYAFCLVCFAAVVVMARG